MVAVLAGGTGEGPGLLGQQSITESPVLVVGPLVVTAAVTLLLGVAPGPLLELVRVAARVAT